MLSPCVWKQSSPRLSFLTYHMVFSVTLGVHWGVYTVTETELLLEAVEGTCFNDIIIMQCEFYVFFLLPQFFQLSVYDLSQEL